jgi:hypothetical protein
MQVFDDVLDILKDGHFHTFEEISSKLKTLNENQLELIFGFLQEYSFIRRQRRTWSLKTRGVKLAPVLENFLKRFRELDSITEVEAAISREESSE